MSLKLTTILIFTLATVASFSQETLCEEAKIYDFLINEFLEKRDDTLAVDIKNSFYPLLREDIKIVSRFTEPQMNTIENTLSKDWDYSSCVGVTEILKKVERNSAPSRDDSYTLRRFSQPVFIADDKAIVVLSFYSRSRLRSGGKGIGYDILNIFKRKNGNWELVERKQMSAS